MCSEYLERTWSAYKTVDHKGILPYNQLHSSSLYNQQSQSFGYFMRLNNTIVRMAAQLLAFL